MAVTTIALGNLDPAQQTVTTGGDYVVAIAALTTNPIVTFSGPAVFNLTGVTSLVAGYTLQAVNGAILNISGLAAAGTVADLVVGAASAIAIGAGVSALSAINAAFSGIGGTLSFAPGVLSLLNVAPTVTGFAPGNSIDFGATFSAGEQAVYSSATGLLSLETASGAVLGAVKLIGSYVSSAFAVAQNAAGDAVLDFACFLRGTMIRTPGGDVAVERLRSGELVSTEAGYAVPIKAVRRRSFAGAQADARTQPICIKQGALGPDMPARDLHVSPDHAMFLDGVLVPASLLQNGSSVVQARLAGEIEYYHVEVDPHAILIAEGAPSESYLDIGSRHFVQPGTVALFPLAEPKTWEDACAPLVLTGPVLDGIRMRLRARAQEIAPPLSQVA